MKMSRKQFNYLLEKNQLILSFIGMSNIGKTYWSEKFRNIGFKHVNCDELIEAKLAPYVKALGYSGIEDIARWMGKPYDKRFPANQQKYLAFEKEVMEIFFAQTKNKESQNTIIDTTGSIIHTGKNICDKLRKYSLVVYIKETENMKENMFNQYIKKPKPVVFGNIFDPKNDETKVQTLKRCYRKLLDSRNTLYAQYADAVIPCDSITENMNINQFILLIRQSL